jgi:hypothetical protein|tara:strand:+ start:195 stop:866 length:672 start_codon:yes stop_codon:yes gene_type:complete
MVVNQSLRTYSRPGPSSADLGKIYDPLMEDRFRDKTRDELAKHLNRIGINAVLSPRGLPHESVGNKWWRRSQGIIELSGGPIGWINIIKKDRSKDSPPKWWVFLGISDTRAIAQSRSVNIKTKRKKSFPIFGKVTSVTWEGQDRDLGLAHELSMDNEVKELATKLGNIRVQTLHDEFSGWVIEIDRKIAPTREQWGTLEKIAGVCLRTSSALCKQPPPPASIY